MKIELAKTEVVHFVGIGGIGMSGLSLIMKGKGFKVQGSDSTLNKNIERLRKEKIKIFIGQKKQNLKNATIVVISSAIKKNNPEILEAKRKKLSDLVDIVILKRYQKIFDFRGGRAVAGLRGNICQGCFQQVLPQMVIEVKVGEKIHQCEGCMRFLFLGRGI